MHPQHNKQTTETDPFPGIDWVQENVLGAGPQNNESAAEQAKDRFIADKIRDQYRTSTGKDFPISEKDKKVEEQKQSGSGGIGGFFK